MPWFVHRECTEYPRDYPPVIHITGALSGVVGGGKPELPQRRGHRT